MRLLANCKAWIAYTIAIAAGLLLLPGLSLQAQQKHKAHPAEKHKVHRDVISNDQAVKRQTTHYAKPKATRHHSSKQQKTHHKKAPHHGYHRAHHRHWPLVRLQPERVKEIQQALVQTGYLQGEPTGKWDTATHDAMQRYQQANGFSPTGLPEAKPLMKLGLGPHPLPPSLEPLRAASAPLQETTEASASPNTPTSARGAGQAQ